RDLATLQAAADRPAPDPGELKAALARVAGAAEAYPEQAPAAHFALGSGWVRLAELTGDLGESRNHWVLARQHFDALRPDQLADQSSHPRLAYRAAKARAATLAPDAPPGDIELLRALLAVPPAGEEPGEARRLIAELSLRLNPPDVKQAKNSLSLYLAETGLATPPAAVARARLRLGEVHHALGEADAAKKWLSQVGAEAPPDVAAPARALLARVRMAEHDWAGAAKDWEAARAVRHGLPPDKVAAAAYHLGVCKLAANPADPVAAAKLFEEAARGPEPEAPAADVRLADLKLKSPDPARRKEAVGLLAAAVKGVKGAADYANPLVPVHDLRAAFEQAVQVLAADGAFEPAVAAAEAYRAVAAGGRDREKKAEALAAWGAHLQKVNADGGPKLAAAAAEYVALADGRTVETDQADLLRKAAGLYRQAKDGPAALAALDRVVKLPNLPDDVSGPAWADYAEGLLAANRPDDAVKAFRQAMASAAPTATATRHQLARRLIGTRDPRRVPLGMELLIQVASAERVTPAEQGVHERALVELAHERIRANDFADAEARLRKQLTLYPTGPEADLGKVLLGTCLLQRSDPKASPRVPDPAKAREEALGLFQQVVDDADARKAANRSADRDGWLRTRARLGVLHAQLKLMRPRDVLVGGDQLRRELSGEVEELFVLNLMYHAYKQQPGGDSGAAAVRDQMRELFDRLKDKPGSFPAASGEYSRAYWEKVWFAPDKTN
ncbi:MAG: hypothetical protein K2X87_15520, partial [Gemmataceae bacterium]|nr:hypothetical protein [Gemmataceae bacterium]